MSGGSVLQRVELVDLDRLAGAEEGDDDGEPHGLYVEQPNVFYGGVVVGANFAQVDGILQSAAAPKFSRTPATTPGAVSLSPVTVGDILMRWNVAR